MPPLTAWAPAWLKFTVTFAAVSGFSVTVLPAAMMLPKQTLAASVYGDPLPWIEITQFALMPPLTALNASAHYFNVV
jgi:hypothetical protein